MPSSPVMGVGTRKPTARSTRRSTTAAAAGTPIRRGTRRSAKGTQLYGIAIPSYGGDTLFASMYDAYATLPGR
jgi:alpha-ketoglutarate-dependent taurine dioxygenase